jgi:hypothetical protein
MGIANIMRNDTEARRVHEASNRAERFLVQIPVRYRTPHSPKWFESRTENVSHTGILFRTEYISEPTTLVEVRLELPPTMGDGAHAEVLCKCQVVRVEQTCGGGISPALAVAILDYRLTRKREPN